MIIELHGECDKEMCVCVCVCGMIMTSLDQVQTPSLKNMTSTCKQTKLNMAKETINYTLLE
jgi:hypothetical protein